MQVEDRHVDAGPVHADHIRRRVRSTAELDRHAAGAGFQPVGTHDGGPLLLWQQS